MPIVHASLFKRPLQIVVLITFAVAFAGISVSAEFELTEVQSPNHQLLVMIYTTQIEGLRSRLNYEVTLRGKPIILSSKLGIGMADGTYLGDECEIVGVESRTIHTAFQQFPGKRRLVANHCTETTFTLKELGSPTRKWQLIVRAYDDGIALRYHVPKQVGLETLRISRDFTQWNFLSEAKATALPLANFTTSHEVLYVQQPVNDLPIDKLFDVPLLIEIPEVGWAAVAEANLTNHAGMYLEKAVGASMLTCALAPRVDDPEVAVIAELPYNSPWRVLFVGEQPESFIESDLLLKLNEPSAIKDASWIKPGITTFPWWNGYYEEDVDFTPGVNTATSKHYIDFCAEYGIPYHSLDGLGDKAWYGGPIVPYEGADITTAVEGLDLPEVLSYAKQQGVKIRVWMHWQGAKAHMKRAFPLYHEWGIEGVMIDFMDRNDQEMINFQTELLQLAADNQLTVNLHGAAPPTGLERTFPNLLNTEAVMNLEYDKWDEHGIPPEHDVTVPFTRMLAGPLDYHQGSLRTVTLEEFHPQDLAPLVIGTPCRTLASYVVLQNHLPMMADYPSAYRSHPLTRVLAKIPATWDETRVLSGEVGEHIAIARRAGEEWWIGTMTNREARDLILPLEFLEDGPYRAEVYQDNLTTTHRYSRIESNVSAASEISLSLAKAGGALIRLTPTPTNPAGWKLVWSDDFDQLDKAKWHIGDNFVAPSSKVGVYDPSPVSVSEDNLVLDTAPGESQLFGRVVSKHAQQFGRWEVRAKIPAGMMSVIRLLPDAPWPSRGEIDIMTHKTNQPAITSSEFHWGTAKPASHESRSIPQQSLAGGQLVSFPAGFHTYAVEWTADQLRFYVDDVYHTIFYSDEVGDFLPKLTAPMHLALELLPSNPAEASKDAVHSQKFLVDWVRIYEADPHSPRNFVNGGFEKQGGSLAGWHVFGNRLSDELNVRPSWQLSRHGTWSLALSGQSSGEENFSGVYQGIDVVEGQIVRAKLFALIFTDDSLANTNNRATMKIEFYNRFGDYFGGPAMLDFKEIVIADSSTSLDTWQPHELKIKAPPGAVEARLSLVFAQPASDPGTIYIDDVEFVASDAIHP